MSAFRLSAGDIAAYGVLPLPHGGIRLSRRISDLRFGGRSARRPVGIAPDFRGALHGGCYPRLQARGALHAFFHYYKSQIARDCGAAVPPRLRFRCRVRDFVRARLFHLPRTCRRFRRKCGIYAGIIFSPLGRTRARRSACMPKKFFCGRALSGEGAFPTDFSFGISG